MVCSKMQDCISGSGKEVVRSVKLELACIFRQMNLCAIGLRATRFAACSMYNHYISARHFLSHRQNLMPVMYNLQRPNTCWTLSPSRTILSGGYRRMLTRRDVKQMSLLIISTLHLCCWLISCWCLSINQVRAYLSSWAATNHRTADEHIAQRCV